jgi:hypothetical protein
MNLGAIRGKSGVITEMVYLKWVCLCALRALQLAFLFFVKGIGLHLH